MEVRKPSNWVQAKVVRISGTCKAGHQVGDEIIFEDTQVRGKICFDAMCSMMGKVYGLRYNADLPWLPEVDASARHACPDALNPVVFELTRVSHS